MTMRDPEPRTADEWVPRFFLVPLVVVADPDPSALDYVPPTLTEPGGQAGTEAEVPPDELDALDLAHSPAPHRTRSSWGIPPHVPEQDSRPSRSDTSAHVSAHEPPLDLYGVCLADQILMELLEQCRPRPVPANSGEGTIEAQREKYRCRGCYPAYLASKYHGFSTWTYTLSLSAPPGQFRKWWRRARILSVLEAGMSSTSFGRRPSRAALLDPGLRVAAWERDRGAGSASSPAPWRERSSLHDADPIGRGRRPRAPRARECL